MNENIDLTKILKNCPKGWEFYSSVYGEVEFDEILSIHSNPRTEQEDELRFLLDDYPIQFKANGSKYHVSSAGEHIKGIGECTFFPSREQRNWSEFTAPWYKKDKFDPKTLHPFDKVIARVDSEHSWNIDFFSCFRAVKIPYCLSGIKCAVIPYNDDTKHLVGTTDDAPDYYEYWVD